MGILDLAGEVVGAVAAVEALEKADPNASLLTTGAAAIAGFEGAGALESFAEKKRDGQDVSESDATDASNTPDTAV
ncbi:hypothetical protein PEP31012_03371 [Pandoraea eparura]|uniref:Uncharacterized protein n=1 Tax=Pandoraea eparura TaxID=2508291 RepID=A0A5E4WP37_9BURK|nr:hypothetical protein [Pandoraea eparura]VVE25364.1 hypothetical protein PEP31012_03371 [Pandoraea eparura]